MNADGYCRSVYGAMNQDLKNTVEKLATEIENTLISTDNSESNAAEVPFPILGQSQK